MLTITRKDLLLTINDNVIPAMGSSDVPVKFVNDTETYQGFLIEPRVGYYVNGCPKSLVCEYSSNTIKIPAEAFKQRGVLVIAIALIDNNDSNHIEVTKELALEVTPAPNGTVILPATDTWQTAVNNLVEQLYNQDYKPQFDEIEENLHNLVKEAQNQQSKANNQQTQIDDAIDVMGDYEIVQDNPTQIRFKKGNGEFGDTVNLGDNLASKSMVNAGYDTYSGNSYSGSASDYGLEIVKAEGNYYQETTNGYQLFDQSKLSDVTSLGVTLKNNGDGSFTITGSGNTTGSFSYKYDLTDEEFSKLCKDPTKVSLNNNGVSNPSFMLVVQKVSDGTVVASVSNGKTVDVSSFLSADYRFRFQFYGANGSTIVAGIVKPMLYCQGDGTWEPFTGGQPSPSPDYAQEPKFFEPKEFVSVGKNLFPENRLSIGTIVGVTFSKYKDEFNKIHYKFTGQPTGNFNIRIIDTLANSGSVPSNLSRTIFKANKPIYIKFDGSFSANMNFYFQYYDNTFKILYSNNILSGQIFIPEKDVTSVFITVFSNRNYNVDFSIMANYGEEPQEYQQYKGMDETPLNIELRSLPNGVCDTYEDRMITRRVEFEQLTKASNYSGGLFVFQLQNSPVKNGSLLCDKYIVEQGSNLPSDNGCSINYNGYFIVRDLDYTDLTTFNNHIAENPIKVWYELAEPYTEQVDLPVIPSYYPFTNAWHDSEVEASDLTWNILARQYGSGQTTIKKDEAVLTELDLNTERKENPTTVKVQLQDSEGKVLYLETSSENIYIQSGRFSGKTVQQVLENSIQAISATDEYIEVDVPDSMTQSIDEEFLVDEVDESETETE